MNERVVEVPFVLTNYRPGCVLDIGADRGKENGYSVKMENVAIETCDSGGDMGHTTYPLPFLLANILKKYDTILLVSSLEHFNYNNDNLIDPEYDIVCVRKCINLLSPDGVIIITVPFGKEKIYDGFIQWGPSRLDKVIFGSKVIVEKEIYYVFKDGKFVETTKNYDWDTVEYGANGAENASGVYCGVWKAPAGNMGDDVSGWTLV